MNIEEPITPLYLYHNRILYTFITIETISAFVMTGKSIKVTGIGFLDSRVECRRNSQTAGFNTFDYLLFIWIAVIQK